MKKLPINACEISKFNTLAAATRYADNCIKRHCVFAGDDGLLWVIRGRYTKKMTEAGYELLHLGAL